MQKDKKSLRCNFRAKLVLSEVVHDVVLRFFACEKNPLSGLEYVNLVILVALKEVLKKP